MRKTILALSAASLLVLAVVVGSGQAPVAASGFLSVLHADQEVSLTAAAGGYQIGVFTDSPGPLGHKVIEVGADYVVLRDIANVTTTRIPIYSIKAIVTMAIPKPAK